MTKTVLQIRLTSEEKEAIRARARSAEMTVTEYILAKCLATEVAVGALYIETPGNISEVQADYLQRTNCTPEAVARVAVGESAEYTQHDVERVLERIKAMGPCPRCQRIAGRSLPECNVCGTGCT